MSFDEKWEAAMSKTREMPIIPKNTPPKEAIKYFTRAFCYQAAKEIYEEQEVRIRAMKKRADQAEAALFSLKETRL